MARRRPLTNSFGPDPFDEGGGDSGGGGIIVPGGGLAGEGSLDPSGSSPWGEAGFGTLGPSGGVSDAIGDGTVGPGPSGGQGQWGIISPGALDSAAMSEMQRDVDEGSTERPRDIFGSGGPRSLAPADYGALSGIDDLVSSLPQGVEAGEGDEPESVMAPMQSDGTQSVSLSGTPPATADMSAGIDEDGDEVSSPVSLFGGDAGPGLVGRGGGLFNGGMGMPGGPSGSVTPTEQMLEMLRSLMARG